MLGRQLLVWGLVGLGYGVCLMAVASPPATQPAGAKLRVGTYDARAIAVVYARSDLNNTSLAKKMQELKDAEARGDQKRVAELKAWGKTHQARLHRQGFAGAPVDDILAKVKDQLPGIASAAHVAVITRDADYVAGDVEVVDVTDELVKLFKPDEKAWNTIRELRKHKPMTIEEVDKAMEHEGH